MVKLLKAKDYDVDMPQRRFGDAGIDFFIPRFNGEFKEQFLKLNSNINLQGDDTFIISPNSGVLIPSGFYTKFPNNIALIGHNRSSVAKRNLFIGACVDDSTYQGMLIMHLVNLNSYHIKLQFGSKIVQFVPTLIDPDLPKIYLEDKLDKDSFFEEKSVRGSGGFGSTD